MLADLILEHAPADVALITPGQIVTWHALAELSASAEARLRPYAGRRVAVSCEPDPITFAALIALDRLGSEAALVDAELLADTPLLDAIDVAATVAGSTTDWTVTDRGRRALTTRAHGVVLQTSGTTGQPKPIAHTWESLATGARAGHRADAEPMRWACGYALRLFAAWQVLLQAWTTGSPFVAAGPMTAADTATFWRDAGVTAASATPSFWRWLLMTGGSGLRDIPLRQVTLGGEPADQPILDRLRATFPQARLTHIYATTEAGRCFAVSDGQAGFPAAMLGTISNTGRELSVDAGELLVRVPNGADWIRTGDLVELDGTRVRFTGRRDDLLNVGGHKVSPLVVETALRRVPGVADVRVYGRRSPIVGQLVACEVVVAPGFEEHAVMAAIDAEARGLTTAERPRLVDVVPRIALSRAGKVVR